MLQRSYIYVVIFLMTIVGAGCSDNHETTSVHTHTDDNVLVRKNDTIAAQQMLPKEEIATKSRSAEAHTHGDAELAVVLEKGVVTIELDSPLYNILGFEHAPETEGQKEKAQKAEQQLALGSELFTFNPKANCQSLSKDRHISLFGKAMAHEYTDHEQDHEDHSEDHEGEEDHDALDAGESHNDILLTYEFGCQYPLKLSYLNVNLFEFFEELSEVDVTFLGPATQKQITLNRKQRQLDITP